MSLPEGRPQMPHMGNTEPCGGQSPLDRHDRVRVHDLGAPVRRERSKPLDAIGETGELLEELRSGPVRRRNPPGDRQDLRRATGCLEAFAKRSLGGKDDQGLEAFPVESANESSQCLLGSGQTREMGNVENSSRPAQACSSREAVSGLLSPTSDRRSSSSPGSTAAVSKRATTCSWARRAMSSRRSGCA